MRHPVILAPRLLASMVIAALLWLIVPAVGQDRMVLGPRQFETDKSGAGAVLCVWSIYLSVQTRTATCALPRRPVDDAIDQLIAAIDEFIIANSSLRPTKAMLEEFKQRTTASEASRIRQTGRDVCKSEDIEVFRSSTPGQIQATAKKLLAVPREPVMNPCL